MKNSFFLVEIDEVCDLGQRVLVDALGDAKEGARAELLVKMAQYDDLHDF